ncbi:MAG: adenosylcobinamide-phosphate synthase CbiB [Lachnospiraceae bacterium]|nr:adenosylcobinamide-phosphate synthase CbiB [Lachnospiraceae bacterium]
MKSWYFLIVPAAAFLLDLVFADPLGRFHPVCFMGKLITLFERLLRRKDDSPRTERLKGAVLCIAVLLVTGAAAFGILYISFRINEYFAVLVAVILSDCCLAAGDLKKESMAVAKALNDEGLNGGRRAVSRIVGRDTEKLNEDAVLRAAVETVAESTNDGEIAPLFWLMIGGPVGGMLYKAVNTMDSMIAYKNEKYLYFGTAAAKLDDIANYIPARLAALLTIAASHLMKGMDGAAAYMIWKRDRRKHESPNSAQTESAFAGALGLKLAGPAYYFGRLKEKPWIGEEKKEIDREDIARANKLMLAVSALGLISVLLVRGGVIMLITVCM